MSQPGIERSFKPAPRPEPAVAVASDCRSFGEIQAERDVIVARLNNLWNLPPLRKKGQGCPSFDDRWTRGLHLLVRQVAIGKIREPPASAWCSGASTGSIPPLTVLSLTLFSSSLFMQMCPSKESRVSLGCNLCGQKSGGNSTVSSEIRRRFNTTPHKYTRRNGLHDAAGGYLRHGTKL